VSASRPTPWTVAQVRAVAACDIGAAVLVLAAALLAADQDSLGDQIVLIDLAVAGLLLAVVAHAALFLSARRAVGQRRLRLLPDLDRRARPTSTSSEGPQVWLPGTARVHRADCPMVAGKAAKPITPARVRSKGLDRCEVCQ
jgi:hypothetical protein